MLVSPPYPRLGTNETKDHAYLLLTVVSPWLASGLAKKSHTIYLCWMYKYPWRPIKKIININWTLTQGLPPIRYFNTKSAMYHTCVNHTDTFPSFTEKCDKIVNLDFNKDLTTLVIPFWSKKIINTSYQSFWGFPGDSDSVNRDWDQEFVLKDAPPQKKIHIIRDI